MADLPPNSLPDFDAVAQGKTLFLPAPGTLGVVVAMSVRPSRKERRFANVGAALAWCENTGSTSFTSFRPAMTNPATDSMPAANLPSRCNNPAAPVPPFSYSTRTARPRPPP